MPEDYRDEAVLRRMYLDEGLTMEQIAERLYVSTKTVKDYLKRYGIKARDKGTPPLQVEYEGKKYTYREIGEIAGISAKAVGRRVASGWPVADLFLPKQTNGEARRYR